MKKFLQILSRILLIINPICGILLVASIGYSYQTSTYWWLLCFTIVPFIVYTVLKFHFYMYREENKKVHIEYLKWKAEFSKTHDLIQENCLDYGNIEYSLWRNKQTGELIEI